MLGIELRQQWCQWVGFCIRFSVGWVVTGEGWFRRFEKLRICESVACDLELLELSFAQRVLSSILVDESA